MNLVEHAPPLVVLILGSARLTRVICYATLERADHQ